MCNKDNLSPPVTQCSQNKALWTSNNQQRNQYSARNENYLGFSAEWQQAVVDLIDYSDFKLIFEGTIPANNPNARICVDNITAYHRPCHQIAASAYEASMRRWLEPIVFVFVGALASALLIAVAIFAIRVNRRRGKKLSPGGSTGSGSSEDGSASPQRPTRQHHRRQQEAMLLHAERLADGPGASVVPIGHGHGPRRPAPPVPASQPSLDELLANGTTNNQDLPPRYEEAMGLVAGPSSSSSATDQPPPHPPRLMRKSGGNVV